MKKILFLILYISVSYAYFYIPFSSTLTNKPRDFTLYRSDNIHGNVQMIGNSVLQTQNGRCPSETKQNNRIYAVYVDLDNDPDTYNSTWANLKLPAGVESKDIVYARLYWQGRVGYNFYANAYGRTVKLKLFGSDSYNTITSIDEDFNYIDGDYQGVADVTDLLKKSLNADQDRLSIEGYNKYVWVANVYTDDDGKNLYGAWSLIVVYKYANTHLKNITLYDGYNVIYDDSKSYTLSGFLTPMRGDVNANFMVFAGEGDVVYPDSISLTDKNGKSILLGTDFFRSSEDINGVNITDRDPNCANTIGIDLRTRAVGTNADPELNPPIISNGQTSTTITLSSNGDQYFPGVFIFSTDLYEPRVCYYIDTIKDKNNNTVYENKQFTGEIEANKKYQISFWIANMKKDSSDETLEPAKKVQVFLNTDDFNYTKESTYIQNIGDSTFSHKTDENKSIYRLGLDANGTDGGTIDVANNFNDNEKKAFINLNGTFIFDNNQTTIDLDNILHFKAAFATSSITISPDKALPIPKCIDFNSKGSVFTPVLGHFNIVNENFTGSTDPTDINDPKNKLYTKISNKSFNVILVSLKDDFTTLEKYAGALNIELIQSPVYSEDDSDTIKKSKCFNAPFLTNTSIYLKSQETKLVNILYPQANKNVTFRIVNFIYSGCSSRNIKKFTKCEYDHYKSLVSDCDYNCKDSGTSNVKAKRCLRCMFKHRDTDIFNYTCARDNFAIRPDHFQITLPSMQNRADKNISINIKALGYNSSTPLKDYNISSSDLNLTAIETNPSCLEKNISYNFNFVNGTAYINYIKYSEVGNIQLKLSEKLGHEFALVDVNDTAASQRLIPTYTSTAFRILPDHFSIYNINLTNFNNAPFTYLSNDLQMSSNLQTIIEADNANGDVTQNYNPTCYAKKTDINITHSSNTSMNNLNNIITQFGTNTKNDNISFTLNENNFTNGKAILNLKINFDRNSSKDKIVDTFNLTLNNINIEDQNETNGTATINQTVNFIYGRMTTSDISTIENTGKINVIFEKWNGNEWVTNNAHNNKIYGDVNKTYTTSQISTNLNENNILGEQNITVTPNVSTRPYKVKLHLNIPNWLWFSKYNKIYVAPSATNTDCLTHPCVNLLFLPKTDQSWTGAGTNQTENNTSNNTVKSVIKQNIKKNNDFHKLSW